MRNPERSLGAITRVVVLLPGLLVSLAVAPAAEAFDPTDPDPAAGDRSGSQRGVPETAPEVFFPHGFPRARLGLDLAGALSQGEFSSHVNGGFGVTGYVSQGFGSEGRFGVRLDGGFLNYGNVVTPLYLGRVWYDVSTTNNIFFATLGPQVEVGGSDVRLYATPFVGLSYFVTSSSIDGWEDAPSTTNYEDLVPAYGLGGGIQIKAGKGKEPILVNLGVRYQAHPTTRYLTEGGILEGPDATYLFPEESRTDMLLFQVGIAVGGYR
jgi:hypothetical protein